MLSPFTGSQRRVTSSLAAARNRLVAALATRLFIVHAAPGSKTEQLGREAIGWGQPVYTFDHPANARLIDIGAAAVKDLDGLMDRVC